VGTRVHWSGEVPAGADALKMFRIGSVGEGQKITPTSISYYGGDAGERYMIQIVPAGNPVQDVTVDADSGVVNYGYPLGGASYLVTGPYNAMIDFGGFLPPIPGPCTIAVSTLTASAAKLPVTILGILEDL